MSALDAPWFQTLRTVDVVRLTGIGFSFGVGFTLLLIQLIRE